MNPLALMGVSCTKIDHVTGKPDGMGGTEDSYADGMEFTAALAQLNYPIYRVGEQEAILGAYKVYIGKDMSLPEFSLFRRNLDGQVFRVITNQADTTTPNFSSIPCKMVYAERYKMPTSKGG